MRVVVGRGSLRHRLRWAMPAVAIASVSVLLAAPSPPSPDRAARVDPGRELLRLQAGTFDPARATGPGDAGLPETPPLRPARASGPVYRIVQLDGPVTRKRRAALETGTRKVVGAVSEHALLVRLAGEVEAERLPSVPGYRAAVPLRPVYKIAPGLLSDVRHSPEGAAETARLDVFVLPGEDVGAIAAAAGGLGRVTYVKRSAPARVRLEVAAAALPRALGALARDPGTSWIERVPAFEPHNDQAVWVLQSYDRVHGPLEVQAADPKPYPESATIWNRGLRGAGQVVAVADTGLEYESCFFRDPDRPAPLQTVAPPAALSVDTAHRKLLAVNEVVPGAFDEDGQVRHGTHVSGSVAGDDLLHLADATSAGHDHGDGMAPEAKIVFEDIGTGVSSSCTTTLTIPSLQDLLEQEYAAGARVSSNSWGAAAGAAAVGPSLEADAGLSAMEDLLVVFSAGNGGGSGLGGVAACKNCLIVGASENYEPDFQDVFGILDPENMVAFSSRGPTSDGRLKPDVVAPGFRVFSNRLPTTYVADENDPACDPQDPWVCRPGFGGCYVIDPSDTCYVQLLAGTSMSTPLVSGMAALAREYFVEGFYPTGASVPADAFVPSGALLKAILVHSGRNMTGRLYERRGTPVDFGPLEEAPSNVQGWGRVVLDDALYFAGDARGLRVIDLPNDDGLATGQIVSFPIAVSPGEPFKATLAWTDSPGLPFAQGSLVNDLDLVVTGPGGTVFRGNAWTADDLGVAGDKESAPDAAARDATNNVEGVLLRSPAPGVYTVRVEADDVPGDSARTTQGFALALSGDLAACTTAPPPADPHVASLDATGVEIAWQPVAGATGYRVYRNDSGCAAPMVADQVLTLPAETTSLAASFGASPALYFTVRAVMSADGCETADDACLTVVPEPPGGTPPPPVPDGATGPPMTAARLDADGGEIGLAWATGACQAVDYHVLYGPLTGVAGPDVTGAVCDLGPAGRSTWTGVPAGDLWFLVVADDGVDVEGPWGERSDGAQRGGGAASGLCGTVARDEGTTCP